MKRAIVAGALLLASGPAFAQSENFRRLEEFMAGNPYMGYVAARLNEFEAPLLKAECDTLKVVRRETFFLVKDAAFTAKSEVPSAGQWIDRLAVDRCGKPATRNIMITVREKEKQLQAAALVPGRTATPPVLQRNAFAAASAEARLKSDCNDAMVVSDTAIDGRFIGGAPWKEDWTFYGCKRTMVIAISFTPEPNGNYRIVVKPK